MKKILLIASLASCAALLAWQQGDFKLPAPFHTESSDNRPRVVAKPDGAQLQLPKGFQIEEYASGFQVPRYMALGPGGELLLSDSANQGVVWLLFDKDKDNKVEEKRELVKGLDRPFGLAFWRDYLYIAERTSLKRYKYDRAAMTVGAGEEVVPMKDYAKGHWTRTVLFDRKGDKMYLAIGSQSNVDAGEDPKRAAINRYNPDGTGHEIVASGTRNPIGMRFYPNTDTLWAAVQERDRLGDDLVPDYFTSIRQGGFYGWPYAYVGPNEDPRRKGEKPDLVAKTIVPDVNLGAHVAVLDFIFYTGRQFPSQYQGGALLALHGSWNRSQRVGYSVVFVPFRNGKPADQPRNFLTGWMLAPDKQEVWGRPVGLLQLPDGSVLLTDDGGNKVWRISYKG
ncbi:MAG: PQQ-dependent sugar dehydrogenase [Bryobacteraceae bacterium]